jgi:hypothetical protein
MAEVLWRIKMHRRAEITAVFLGTYRPRGMYASFGAYVVPREIGVGEG